MKKHLVLIFTFLSTIAFSQNKKIDSLFIKFEKSSFYENVYPSKLQLENYQKQIIPKLISFLKDTSFVKLTGTADLIYPGASEFYGHGHFIPYDMDWISVRAGWLLEDLTFQDFGYKTSGIDDEYLLELMKEKYPEYIKNGSLPLNWKNIKSKEKWIKYRMLLAENAEKWWIKNEKNWTRINAIKEALRSNNENRLSEVFEYLRFGETRCDKLDANVYALEIEPLVKQIDKSQFENIAIQIEYLLREGLGTKLNSR